MKVHGSAAVEQLTWCKEGKRGILSQPYGGESLAGKRAFLDARFARGAQKGLGIKTCVSGQ